MISVTTAIEAWPYARPFHITGHTWTAAEVVIATASRDGLSGRGEAAGVYYHHEAPQGLAEQIAALGTLSAASPRAVLLDLLPPGGARNALDCALWDLEAKLAGRPVWRLAGLDGVRPLVTTFTLGADAPEAVAEGAKAATRASALKLKLVGDGLDGERVRLARRARPDAWIGVDANQGFTQDSLETLMPVLADAKVELIEQPFPVGREAWLDGLDAPIPIAADESVCDIADLEAVVGRAQMINIKLDKCGGLTRALALAAVARRMGFKLMVGNMGGTSLAMAPAFVLAQVCDLADLDGPTVLREDRAAAVAYAGGRIDCPAEVWGGPVALDGAA